MSNATAVPNPDSEKCANCMYNPKLSPHLNAYLNMKTVAFCSTCVWAQRTLTDNYRNEGDYFDIGPEIMELADNYPDNIYRRLFEISSNEYTKRPKHLEENVEYALGQISNKIEHVELNAFRLYYKEFLSTGEISRILKQPQKSVSLMLHDITARLGEYRWVIRYGPGAPVTRQNTARREYFIHEMSEKLSPEVHNRPFLLMQRISFLNLSMRALKNLYAADIDTIEKLTKLSEAELLDINGIGQACADEIKTVLAEHGLSLRD